MEGGVAMSGEIDQTIGMQLDAEFEDAIKQVERMISMLGSLQTKIKNLNTEINKISKLSKAFSSIADTKKLDSSLDSAVNSIKKFNDQLNNVNTNNIERVTKQFERLMSSINAFYTRYQKLNLMPSGTSSIKDSALSRSKRQISTALDQIAPLRANTEEASKSIRKMDRYASSLGETLKKAFSLGNIIYFSNMFKSLGTSFASLLLKPIDFAETENKFTAAFGRMRDEAYKFGNDLSEAFGLALPNILEMESTFKNMLGSIGGLEEEMSTQLSETMTKMTIDFASLYNVSIESASQKMQSALSRQVNYCPLYLGRYSESLLIAGNLNTNVHGNQQRSL